MIIATNGFYDNDEILVRVEWKRIETIPNGFTRNNDDEDVIEYIHDKFETTVYVCDDASDIRDMLDQFHSMDEEIALIENVNLTIR